MPMVFITSGTSFVVPVDCNKFDWIDCIGEGGGCGNSSSLPGGAGGAWSRVNNLTVTPGSTVYCQIGTGASIGVAGKDTWINKTSNSAPTSTADGCLAKGGGTTTGGPSVGGAAASGVGDSKYSGGDSSSAPSRGGGGGAAGPNGNGNNGSSTDGGSADAGLGGAGGISSSSTPPGNGTEYDATHGSGGGGYGKNFGGSSGGKYGGGAGGDNRGGQISGGGLIAYSYTPAAAAVTSFNMPMMGM